MTLPRRLLKILISTHKLCGIQSYTEPKKGFVIIEKKMLYFSRNVHITTVPFVENSIVIFSAQT